jgi:hypothetical protein
MSESLHICVEVPMRMSVLCSLHGDAHEMGPLFKLVEQFVQMSAKGCIDGTANRLCKQQWNIEMVQMKRKGVLNVGPTRYWLPAVGSPPRLGYRPIKAD